MTFRVSDAFGGVSLRVFLLTFNIENDNAHLKCGVRVRVKKKKKKKKKKKRKKKKKKKKKKKLGRWRA